MKNTLVFILCLLSGQSNCFAADATLMTLPVDSPAFVFSPGNWTGDAGRAGKDFRQTWNPGVYFRVTWESKNPQPVARLRLDISTYQPSFKPPLLAYSIDGIWKSNIPCAGEIAIEGVVGAGRHELAVYLQQGTWQQERWGSEGKSGLNVLRVTGLQVDAASTPVASTPGSKWAMIVGDSITEGNGASELAGYSHLVGQAQYYAKELKEAFEARKNARPADAKIAIIDLGSEVAKNLEVPNGLMGGLHPNDRGHANFAATIIPQMVKLIEN